MGYTLETMAYMALIALAAVFAIGSVGVSLGYSNMLPLALPGNLPGANQAGTISHCSISLCCSYSDQRFQTKVGLQSRCDCGNNRDSGNFCGHFFALGCWNDGSAELHELSLTRSAPTQRILQLLIRTLAQRSDFGATIFMLPFFAIFVYPWLNAGPAVASEIKGKGALRYNVFISSIVTLIVVTAGFASMYYAGGFNFINGALGNSNLVFNWSFNFWTLAMGVSSTRPLPGSSA